MENLVCCLGETTDGGNDAQLMVSVRYRAADDYVEQFLFCRQLSKNTTAEEIFEKVDSFFQEHPILWSDCVSVCADGAPSVMGIRKGFTKQRHFYYFVVIFIEKT